MTGAKQRGLRVDFIALHWYGSDFSSAAVGHLRGYIQPVHQQYKLPIWLTEFALIKFDGRCDSIRATRSRRRSSTVRPTCCRGLSYVERYSWFGLPSTR